MQETLLRAWRNLAVLERSSGSGRGWLFTVAKHIVIDQWRSASRRPEQADLDTQWPNLGTPELVWASASMHHMADPYRTLRKVYDLLAPGGLFAVVELAGFPRFLPENAPEDRPGLEERCHAALAHHHAEHVPHRGANWGPKLTAAGFTVE